MAIVHGGWAVQITFRDRGDNQTTRTFETNFGSAALVADVVSAANDLIADLNIITGADILSYSLVSKYVQDTPQDLSLLGEIENTAILSFDVQGVAGKRATVTIPAANDGIFVAASGPNYNIVDVTDADLVAFVAEITGSGPWRFSDGEQLNTLIGGRRVHRRSNRGGSRRIG